MSGDGRKTILYSNRGDSGWGTINIRMISALQVFRTTQVDTVILEPLFFDYTIGRCRLLKITALGEIQESLQKFTRRVGGWPSLWRSRLDGSHPDTTGIGKLENRSPSQ
ncbi:MAG: hypothetical protein AB7T38_14590 [Nitrospirales bacterium]